MSGGRSVHGLLALLAALHLGCGSGDPVGGDRFGDSGAGGGGVGGNNVGGEPARAGGSSSEVASSSSTTGGGESFEDHCFGSAKISVFPLDLTEGDSEFEGHGPSVSVTVNAARDGGSIRVEACVDMKETQSDWTTGHACKTKSFPVDGLLGLDPDPFEAGYVDSDHETDALESSDVFDSSPLVEKVTCRGDRDGDDVCGDSGCAGCDVQLGCIEVHVSK